jgi:hypothetical protein
MRRLDAFSIRSAPEKTIELWQGDLTSPEAVGEADVVVVSAFSGDYTPTENSLIGAFDRSGVSVAELAICKDIDLLAQYGCWLSRPIAGSAPRRRILCFEPYTLGQPPAVVGDLFRALTPILAVRPDIRSIAIPLLSTGDMALDVDVMVDSILEAATHWAGLGMPIMRILLVAYSDAKASVAAIRFASQKSAYAQASSTPAAQPDYDVFVSYAHANAATMDAFAASLEAERPGIRLFVDRHELSPGAAWQIQIFESLDRCRKVVTLLSPEYVRSKACAEEFNMAWIRARNFDQDLLFPIYVASADLPTYMLFKQYVDCRDDDGSKLEAAARRLVASLTSAVSEPADGGPGQ